MNRKCEVCGESVGPEGKTNHWRKYHPKYFRIYTMLWILSGAFIVGGTVLLRIIEVASPASEASSLADWIGYPVLGIGAVLLFLAMRFYLGRVRKSLKDSGESSPQGAGYIASGKTADSF
jgi:protein-S-isoprenylcysteine O-methyltransferase Ste14